MKKIFNQDNIFLGIIIGAIVPWIILGILYFLNIQIGKLVIHIPYFLRTSTLQLVAIVVNVFIMRYYMVKLKFEKTGKGLLLMTFIYIIAFFVNEYIIKF